MKQKLLSIAILCLFCLYNNHLSSAAAAHIDRPQHPPVQQEITNQLLPDQTAQDPIKFSPEELQQQAAAAIEYEEAVTVPQEAKIFQQLGIQVNNPQLIYGPLDLRFRTDGVIIHHTATPTGHDWSAQEIHEMHLKNGWSGFGYHFEIHPDGSIDKGRPLHTMGAQAEHHNDHTVGICLSGNFEFQQPSQAQLASAARLVAAICQIYGIKPSFVTIKGHYQYNSTLCPGRFLKQQLPYIRINANKLLKNK